MEKRMTRPIRALIDTYALEKNLSLLVQKAVIDFCGALLKPTLTGTV